jgi:pimeloyl-ACP methyl ester carboxylesterase
MSSIGVSRLHLDLFGVGPPAVFVHGSFGWGLDTFPEQRALAGEYRIVLVDRRGFGGSRWAEAEGWPADMHDLATLLDEIGPAHLVGQSYGAVVVLLAAGLRPERVLSLVAIEPPAFEVASGDPDADRTIAALKPVFERAAELTTREFVHEWARAGGGTEERIAAWTESLDELGWAAAEASRRERWPGDAPIRYGVLASASFPKVLARGAWKPEVVGREGAGRDYAAVCQVIADQIGARVAVFEQSGHNPQLQEPQAFNQLLRATWDPGPPIV